jgi:hypothetical protein
MENQTVKKQEKTLAIRRVLVLGGALVLLAVGLATFETDTVEAGVTSGPDITVIYLPSTANYGVSNGIRGYAVGTTSCNVGDQPGWWCDNDRTYCEDDQHPVIAQNLYRLKDDRFEQIGMSWLKHGFLSLNTSDGACGSCTSPPHGGDQLGVGCTDAYGAGLNGFRPLGMRSEVDPTTGAFPYPFTNVGAPAVPDQRMQVEEVHLDPTLNSGALYWIEGHYIAADDAAAGNGLNNASYREVKVTGSSFNLSTQGPTVREQAAIFAWQATDPSVEILDLDVDQSRPIERFHIARKVKNNGGGSYHYEYAIHNMNSARAARSFTVHLPPGTPMSEVGFHDADHHSGEPFEIADWAINEDQASGTLSWSTSTFADDELANALRWGTMFTFWFDADTVPDDLSHTVEFFKEGSPLSMDFSFPVEPPLFVDGFESGDSSAWTTTFP